MLGLNQEAGGLDFDPVAALGAISSGLGRFAAAHPGD